jgi:hypothetical protein
MQNSGDRALKQAPVRGRKRERSAPTPGLPVARLRYLAGRVHALGERPLFELLSELQRGLPFAERVEAYAGLADLAPFIKQLGGDHLPPTARLVRKRSGAP